MLSYFRELVPSMFQRRMVALMLLFPLAMVPAVAQLARLTIAEHQRHKADADSKLRRSSWTPTVRGRILDARGRVLAEAAPSYEARVSYRVLTGDWAQQRARRYARRQHGREALDPATIEQYALVYQQHVESMLDELASLTGSDRGVIDQRRADIIRRVGAMHAELATRREQLAIEEATEQGRPLTEERLSRIRRLANQPIAEQTAAHTVLRSLTDEVAFELARVVSETVRLYPAGPGGPSDEVYRYPGLDMYDASARRYPMERQIVEIDLSTLPGPLRSAGRGTFVVEGADTPITGWLRQGPRDTDIERRASDLEADPRLAANARSAGGGDRGAYRPTDSVGAFGIEASFETRLRGLRGQRVVHLDTGRVESLDAVPGEDVRLTIDARLQARVQALMSPELGLAVVQPWQGEASETMPIGTTIHGGAVVLDIDTGAILAMVSTPSFTRVGAMHEPSTALFDPITLPWINKAIAKPYPPGSVAKAPVLCAAHARGVYAIGEAISCTGHFQHSASGRPRCWIYKRFDTTHDEFLGSPAAAAEAMMVSCNIFFAELGRRLGPGGIAWAYQSFGVGEDFDLGLGYESAGLLGPGGDSSKLITGDAIQMGIGQGPIAWTPLHAADALATIAREGRRVRPHVVAGDPARLRAPSVPLHPRVCRETLEGLRLAVADRRGTGHHLVFAGADGARIEEPIFNAPGVRIWGKTGTATAPPLVADPDGPGPLTPRVIRSGDHSWFVVLVGDDRPRYAISVLMEFAGSGGKVSGPIANQIIHAMLDEGYLRGAN